MHAFFFQPSRPKDTVGGVRLQSDGAQVAEHWWGERWLAIPECLDRGSRLSRGKSYARKGQVTQLQIKAGSITASVQGTRPKPYRTSITCATIEREDWLAVTRVLREEPLYAAQLLTHSMPEDIEERFWDADLAFFPERKDDLEFECTCPDPGGFCKHHAALWYLFGEAFDADPFLLFRLRGADRGWLLRLLGVRHGKNETQPDAQQSSEVAQDTAIPAEVDGARFWQGRDTAATHERMALPAVPRQHAALLKALGPLPFWQHEEGFQSLMAGFYEKASRHAPVDVLKDVGATQGR